MTPHRCAECWKFQLPKQLLTCWSHCPCYPMVAEVDLSDMCGQHELCYKIPHPTYQSNQYGHHTCKLKISLKLNFSFTKQKQIRHQSKTFNFPGLNRNAGSISTVVFTLLQTCIQVHLHPLSGGRRHNLPHMGAHWVVMSNNESMGRFVSIHTNVPFLPSCVIESNKAVSKASEFIMIIFQWWASRIIIIKLDVCWQPWNEEIIVSGPIGRFENHSISYLWGET